MLRALINKCLGRPANPVQNWPKVPLTTPEVGWAQQAIGRLRFGDDLSLAELWGKPDSVLEPTRSYCQLLYARAGFQVEFASKRLNYAVFFLASEALADAFIADVPEVSLAKLRLDGIELSHATTLAEVEAVWGAPSEKDEFDEAGTIFYYRHHGLTVEFEATTAGTLKRMNIYPSEEGVVLDEE